MSEDRETRFPRNMRLPSGMGVYWSEGNEHWYGYCGGCDHSTAMTCDRYHARRMLLAHRCQP